MEQYDYGKLEAKVSKLLLLAEAPTWDLIAQKLGRWAAWEFEDYKP